MKIVIAGRHEGVTESMKAYAEQKVQKLERYFDRATMARVTLDKERDVHLVEIVFDVPRGVSLVGKAEAPDVYAACDLAEQKLATQLRRFKQRLRDHRPSRRPTDEIPTEKKAAESSEAGSDESVTYEDVIDRLRRGE